MQKRQIAFNFKGIAQDAINGSVNSQFAYKITNMRISASKNSNVLQLTTEKGTTGLRIDQASDDFVEDGIYLGHCVVGNYVILFVTSEQGDFIYRLDFKNHDVDAECRNELIFHGNLNFNENHRIESIGIYENENIQKVYWIDGLNQPRVINVVSSNLPINISTQDVYTGFDFIQKVLKQNDSPALESSARIIVEKQYDGGNFTAGVIQYGYSLYNLNGQETPIIDITSLLYITDANRGGAPNEVCNCSFKINIENRNLASDFDYIRIYSIQRQSLNGTPIAKVVVDLPFDNEITYVDDGNGGYDIDYTYLQWKSNIIIPHAITTKDNYLIFGNYDIPTNQYDYTSLFHQVDVSTVQWAPGNFDEQYKVKVYNNNIYNDYNWVNQLDTESAGVKSFKYKETYNLAIQFQDVYGNWSQPYIVGSYIQDKHPLINNSYLVKPIFTCNCSEVYNLLSEEERELYVRVRPLVQLPSFNERSVLCQGIVNPTVFNLNERANGNLFSQASWFFRPYFINKTDYLGNKRSYKEMITQQQSETYGSYVQCNHFYPLYQSDNIGGELQNMFFDTGVNAQRKWYTISGIVNHQVSNPLEVYEDFYYVDQSIATLNSSDIEFNNDINTVDVSNYDIRIIGAIPFTKNIGKQIIITNSSPLFLNNKQSSSSNNYYRGIRLAKGFVDSSWNNSKGRLTAITSWFDDINDLTYNPCVPVGTPLSDERWNSGSWQVGYMTYPFQRKYLNNYSHNKYDDRIVYEEYDTSEINKKILSNLKFSQKNIFLDNDIYGNNLIVEDIKLIDGNSDKIYRVNNKFYGSSIDYTITTNSVFTQDAVVFGTDTSVYEYMMPNGYPYIVASRFYNDNEDNLYKIIMYYHDPIPMCSLLWNRSSSIPNNGCATPELASNDPIELKYKSNKHIVFELGENANRSKQILPYPWIDFKDTDIYISNPSMLWNGQYTSYENSWTPANDHVLDNFMFGGSGTFNEFLWLAELYKDVNSTYLLTNDSNKYIRQWIPCGKAQQFGDFPGIDINWIEGDTYYQRYDCLKTLPYSDTDYQSVVDIASFMVETYINLDGRYDENRGLIDNTFINNSNFNLINPVYNQENNFFTYYILDENKFNINKFPVSVVWSNQKKYGEEIDIWTKINTVNQLDLDGNKGSINALRKFRNNVYAFQNSSVSRIRFNDRTALSTVEGLPIQLASSDTVDGYEFINEVIGCQNKFSNIETENGIYFIDNNTPGIYKLGYNEYGNINIDNISKQKLMQRWFENNNDRESLTFYDRNINEVLFNIHNNSLVFSMDSNYFSQFINYEKAKDVININNISIAVLNEDRSLSLHTLRTGYYSNFFGEYKDYGVDFIACPQIGQDTNGIIRDCIYDNVWYRSDVFDTGIDSFDNNMINTNYLSNETFDEIHVIDTYQNNSSILNFNLTPLSKITTLRKKFMMWYARIPRHKYRMQNKNYDRMRDKFIKISFTKHQTENHKMVLGDIVVDCFY